MSISFSSFFSMAQVSLSPTVHFPPRSCLQFSRLSPALHSALLWIMPAFGRFDSENTTSRHTTAAPWSSCRPVFLSSHDHTGRNVFFPSGLKPSQAKPIGAAAFFLFLYRSFIFKRTLPWSNRRLQNLMAMRLKSSQTRGRRSGLLGGLRRATNTSRFPKSFRSGTTFKLCY